jgi:FtsH-binding integral membrane protein
MMSNQYDPITGELKEPHSLVELSDLQIDKVFKTVMRRVYLWMALGLLMTTGAALATALTPFGNLIFSSIYVFYGLMFGELILVMVLSAGIRKLHPALAGVMFFAYAALNGVTLSAIFLVYQLGSIGMAFFVAACLFGAMSLIGYSTKKDLSSWGSFLMMGLIGLVIAMVVNIFLASSGLDWVISIVGVLLFLGLTIFDTQRIKRMTVQSMQLGDEAVAMKMGILGALKLYLDFINIFLYLLRFFGRRRR